MRKLICLLLCCIILAMPVLAFDGITSAQNQTTILSDGTCQITLTATLELSKSSAPDFPLPENAGNITLNGTHAKTSRSNNTRNVDLSGIVGSTGTYTLTFRYTLPDIVTADDEGNLTLALPLLSGFALPIEQLSFSVELPSEPERRPHFSSTYLDESVIDSKLEGNVVSGFIDQRLPDHENLTMTMQVSKEMFPQVASSRWSMDTVDLLMAIVFSLALLGWLITMRCLPPRRTRRALPTPGLNAGEIPCILKGQGMDLTMAVLSWAQMGYILIQTNNRGRVLLHKRMEMGNERSQMENKLFRSLFSKRDVADACSTRYALLYRKAMFWRPGVSAVSKYAPQIIRILVATIGTLGGVSLGIAFANDVAWQVFWSIVLGLLGSAAAWQMQSAAAVVFHRNKFPLLIGLGCGLIWFLLSLLAGEWHTSLFVVLTQLLFGAAVSFGGRKTESEQQTVSEILGLRRFMRTATQDELKRISNSNPHYFYDLAPYSLALDIDRTFARRFGNAHLPECPYLTTGADTPMSAQEWAQLLRDTVDAMDMLQRRLPVDRLLGRFGRL